MCWYLTLLMVWILSRDKTRGRTSRGIACLALAAVFPGQVYFAALFPISLVTFAVLLCSLAGDPHVVRRRPQPPSELGCGRRCRAYVSTCSCGSTGAASGRTRYSQSPTSACTMLAGAAAVVAGLGLVLAYAQLSVGKWNAYFISEREEYGVRAHNPLDLLVARYHQLLHPSSS